MEPGCRDGRWVGVCTGGSSSYFRAQSRGRIERGKEVREREHEGETLRPVVFREGFLSWGVFRQDLQEG